MKEELSADARKALEYMAAPMRVAYALEVGRLLDPKATNRSAAAKGAGVLWSLVCRRLVTRKLGKRELYRYTITEAGRAEVRG